MLKSIVLFCKRVNQFKVDVIGWSLFTDWGLEDLGCFWEEEEGLGVDCFG
jgi:hypothetical protein